MIFSPLRRSARLAEKTAIANRNPLTDYLATPATRTEVKVDKPISVVATPVPENLGTMTVSEAIVLLDEVKTLLTSALMELNRINVTTSKLNISYCTYYRKAVHLLGKIRLLSRVDGVLIMYILESCSKDITNIHYKMRQCYEDTHLTVITGRMFVQYIYIRINNIIEQLNILQEWTK
jgi:hypothetical protein